METRIEKKSRDFLSWWVRLGRCFLQTAETRKQNSRGYSPFSWPPLLPHVRFREANLMVLVTFISLPRPYLSIFSYKVTHIFFFPISQFQPWSTSQFSDYNKSLQCLYLHVLSTPVYLQHSQHENLLHTTFITFFLLGKTTGEWLPAA